MVRHELVAPVGEDHGPLGIGGLVHLRPSADLADPAGHFVAGAQQTGGDGFVEVEGGEFAGDPGAGGGLVAGDGAAGTPDEGEHAPPRK
ncbi:hypothetical protein [Streptomyces sp. NPDC001450]